MSPTDLGQSATADDIAKLRKKLKSVLPASEARLLDSFLDRISRKREVKAAQARRYRAKRRAKA